MKNFYAAPVTPANAFFIKPNYSCQTDFNSEIECQKTKIRNRLSNPLQNTYIIANIIKIL